MHLSAPSVSAIGLLRVLLVASLLVPLTLLGIVSYVSYRMTVESAEHDLSRTSEVAREHAEKVFDTESQLEDRINELLRQNDATSIRENEEYWHTTLNEMVARFPHVASVMVASKNGEPLVSAEVFPVPRNVDLHGRDYFDAILAGDQGPFFSNLQVGNVYQHFFFGLARPWTTPDNTLKGVIDIAVSPKFFLDFYMALADDSLGSNTGKVVLMLRDNGRILSRYPPFNSLNSSTATPATFLAAIRTSPNGGLYKAHSIVDPNSPLRLFAYRRVRNYPLYVVAGRSWDAIMGDWRRVTVGRLLFGLPLVVLLYAVTWTALARTRREAQALVRANLEIQRRQAAEDALLRAQRLEAVGQMTGGIAHDFNNLLTVIAGNATLIDLRAEEPAITRRLAASIQLAAKRGAEITQQLLAFAGRQTIRPETIDVNARLREFKPLLDRAAREAVQICLDLTLDLPPVRIDPGQFEAAVLNLVGNARDAMPNGGLITISTRYGDGSADNKANRPAKSVVRIAVSDNGTGMDRETVAKAFEPFFTTKEVGKGTGLGLSQVYGFARQAGGNARIVSTLGQGTTIEISLPASTETPLDKPTPHPIKPAATDHSGSVVLVVEDEPNVLEMAVETIKQLGYIGIAANGPQEALERLKQADRVDVLFTDMVMPGGMNGLQLSTEARQLCPAIKVLLTSGYIGLASTDVPGNIPLLPKPYDRDQLSLRLEAVLANTE